MTMVKQIILKTILWLLPFLFDAPVESLDLDSINETVDLSDIHNYGFFASPEHPAPYPNGASCRYEFLKLDQSSPLVDYPTSIAFLRFKTSGSHENGSVSGDTVTVYQEGVMLDSLAGSYQSSSGSPERVSNLPTFSKPAKNFTILFDADEEGTDGGFLFAFASKLRNMNKEQVNPGVKSQTHPETLKEHLAKSPKEVVTIDFSTHQISSTSPRLANTAHFGSPGRQGELVDYGFFMSPNHPNPYGDEEDVLYEIVAPDNKRVAISTVRFDLQENVDFLSLHDAAADDEWPTLFTGTLGVHYVWITTRSSNATARFTSNWAETGTGFLAAVAAVDITDE